MCHLWAKKLTPDGDCRPLTVDTQILSKNTKNLKNAKNYALQHAFWGLKNSKNSIKNNKNHVVQHIFWKILKNYFADNQGKEKILKFFIVNILVVSEKVVPLHPQSREVATEQKTVILWISETTKM